MITITSFNKKLFLKLVLISLILNLIWGLIATRLEIWHGRDKGFISGTGYLVVYGLTFFLVIDKSRRKATDLLALVFCFIATFVVSSFVVGPLATKLDYAVGSSFIAIAINTLFSAVLIVIIISRYFDITFKVLTGAATFIVALVVTLVVGDIIKKPQYFDLKVFNAISIFYTTWQVLTTTTLALGIAIK